MQLGYFRNAKGQREYRSTLAFIVSHEARRRMAVFSVQLAVYHTKPASRGTLRATAAFPAKASETRGLPPSVSKAPLFSTQVPRPMGAVWGAGRREEAGVQWTQPPQAVSDRQPSTETRLWHGSAKDDD